MIAKAMALLGKRHDEEELKKGSKGFTLIELMVVLLIMGILMAIAIPTYLGERGRAQNTAAQSTVTNALLAAKSVYASQGAYQVPPSEASTGCGGSGCTTFGAYMQTQEPSIKWVDAGGTSGGSVNNINEVSDLVYDNNQAITITAFSPNGKCWSVTSVEDGSAPNTNSPLAAGTWYNESNQTSSACTAAAPTGTSGWANTWAGA